MKENKNRELWTIRAIKCPQANEWTNELNEWTNAAMDDRCIAEEIVDSFPTICLSFWCKILNRLAKKNFSFELQRQLAANLRE